MVGDHKQFPGQHEGEIVIFFFRRHWIRLVSPIAKFMVEQLIIFIILFFILSGNIFLHTIAGRIIIITSIVLIFFSITKLWIHIFNYFLHVTIVTNYRILDITQRLIITNDRNIIDLLEIEDVKAESHGFLHNILQYGTIKILTSAADREFDDVPTPAKIASHLVHVCEIKKKIAIGEALSFERKKRNEMTKEEKKKMDTKRTTKEDQDQVLLSQKKEKTKNNDKGVSH